MRKLLTAIAFLGIALAHTANAQESATRPVDIQLTAFKVDLDEHGNESLSTAEAVTPGDTLEYRAIYANRGETPVNGLLGTLPIPSGMAFIADSQAPSALEVSLDGQVFSTPPLFRDVLAPNGALERTEVPASEYRFLRWSLDELKAGAEVAVSARMQVKSE